MSAAAATAHALAFSAVGPAGSQHAPPGLWRIAYQGGATPGVRMEPCGQALQWQRIRPCLDTFGPVVMAVVAGVSLGFSGRRRQGSKHAARQIPSRSRAGRGSARFWPTRSTSAISRRQATDSMDTVGVSGNSIWPGGQEPSSIGDDLLEKDWAPLMDHVKSIEGVEVRACRKGAKQVATLGPASWSVEMLERLFLCGVDVFRLNFSHGEYAEKAEQVANIRKLEMKYKHPICILADMQGPKQRCGKFANQDGVVLKNGQRFRFDLDTQLGDEQRVQLPHPEILIALTPGKTLLLDDGKLRMRVERVGCIWKGTERTLHDPSERPSNSVTECPPFIECTVEVGGKLSDRKGVNTPDVVLPISPITAKDRKDLAFACSCGVDWIGMSFVQRHEDMMELRQLIDDTGFSRPRTMAKIEKPSAVEDLQRILEESDGVMVARGDLGVEMNPEEVPFVQKDIISKANALGKPVIVATQMLESMIFSPAPTRAECSDIANAVLDGCDGVMLSGETAVGSYPLECVQMQRRVINASERQMQPADFGENLNVSEKNAILASATALAQGYGSKAIVCFTTTGSFVQQLARLRPSMPILAVCSSLETARWLSMLRGVYTTSDDRVQAMVSRVNTEGPHSVPLLEGIEVACDLARQKGIALQKEDTLVVTSRLPLFSDGLLNVIHLASAMGPSAADVDRPAQVMG